MTERKSTEIKIRVTPSEKARWQTDAEQKGMSLSELICRRMNFSADLALQAASLVPKWTPDSHPATATTTTQSYFQDFLLKGPALVDPPERRKEPCSHSRPPYAFCAECDR